MIKNLWKCTKFCCTHRHDSPVEMQFVQGPSSLFYACPKYYPENRTPDERACPMRLNTVDAEAILEKFSKIIESDEAETNYTNLRFSYKDIDVKVLEYNKDGIIKLNIYNKKALR